MSSDVAIDVTALAIVRLLPGGRLAAKAYGRHGTAAAPPARTGAPYWMEG